MEMEIPFPFCVPVAAGIVSVFMGTPKFPEFSACFIFLAGDRTIIISGQIYEENIYIKN